MIHGIRILSKKGCHLKFKTYLIYSDWNRLPKTHGFPILFLSDYTDFWKHGDTAFEKDLESQKADIYKDEGHTKLSRRYIKSLSISDFQNFPLTPEFLEYTWHYLDEDKKFHAEEHLPQATYELEVTDEKWIEHIPEGAVWETTACDFMGPYWHLETSEEKGKFYKIFQNIDGRWMMHYGKKGAKGRTEGAKYMSASYAAKKVEEKLKKGYVLVYKNFDSDWNTEDVLKGEAAKQEKKDRTPPNTELFFKALEKGDFPAVEKFLSDGIDPNTLRDEWDNYALENAADGHRATEERYKITKLLLEKGADPNVGNYGPFFPGICYSYWDNPWQEKIIELFLESGVDIAIIGGSDKHSVLQTAAVSGRVELLKQCIDAGLDVMHRTAQGHTAMHYAASNKRNTIEIIDLLLATGADVNDNNGSWGTPLHFAARGSAEVVLYLGKNGADINLRDSKGRQPIHTFAEYGEFEIFEAGLKLGADPDSETDEGVRPIELILTRIIGSSPKLNEIAFKKLSVLSEYTAIDWKEPKIANALFGKSRSKNKVTKAEESRFLKLIELGFDAFLQDSKGFNLFLLAARTQSPVLIEACLKSATSAQVNLQDEYGWTAMHYAKAVKSTAIVNLMTASECSFDKTLASKKQRKILKVKYLRGTTAESIK